MLCKLLMLGIHSHAGYNAAAAVTATSVACTPMVDKGKHLLASGLATVISARQTCLVVPSIFSGARH